MGGSSSQTVGYRYYIGLHMGICAGPIDSLREIRGGDRVAWSGNQTGSGGIVINAPEIYGGDEKEGGIQGFADVMMGEASQGPNSYLASQQVGLQPAYRGILSLVFRRGLIAANNPYIKPWAFKVRRILKGWQNDAVWYPEKAAITLDNGGQGMNPAHVIYECLTNQEWGLGYGAIQINDAVFRAAADKFHAEGLGLCLIWTRQEQLERFIQSVVDHCGAVMTQEPTTGLFVLYPMRGDYDPEDLLVLDEKNIIALESYQRAASPEATNELTVQYVDSQTGKKGSVTLQNIANVTSQGGIVSQTKNYPGIPTAELALRTAARDLNVLSTPLSRVRLRANRQAYNLMPGSLFRLNWPKLGLVGLVMRVGRVNRGTLTSGEILIEAVEDVFGLPAATYAAQQPPGWVDPSTEPAPATNRVVQEAPFWEVQRTLGYDDAVALPADAGYVMADAVRPSGDSLDFGIFTRTGSTAFKEVGRGAFCPSGTIVAPLSHAATSCTIEAGIDLDLVTPGGYAQIDSEIVRVDALNAITGAMTIGRGVLDTVAAQHSAGARLYFIDGFGGVDPTERIDGETLDVKLRPRTGRGQLPEISAPTDAILLDARIARPYPPGRLRINGETYPESVSAETVTISWSHRDRLQQNLEGDETGNIGPELGTTYTVELRNPTTNALLYGQSGITGTSYTTPFLLGTFDALLNLWSVRGGLESRQKHSYEFTYLYPPGYATAPGTTFSLVASKLAAGLYLSDESGVSTGTDAFMAAKETGGDMVGVTINRSGISTTNWRAIRVGSSPGTSGTLGDNYIQVAHGGGFLYVLAYFLDISGTFFEDTTVYRLDYANLAATPVSRPSANPGDFQGIAHDGTNLWILDAVAKTLIKCNAATLATITSYGFSDNIRRVFFAGGLLWVSTTVAGQIIKVNPATGAEVARRTLTVTGFDDPNDVHVVGSNAVIVFANSVVTINAASMADVYSESHACAETFPSRASQVLGGYVIVAAGFDGVVAIDAATGKKFGGFATVTPPGEAGQRCVAVAGVRSGRLLVTRAPLAGASIETVEFDAEFNDGGMATGQINAPGATLTAAASFIAGGASSVFPENVQLLLHMEGADASTTFTDSSIYARTATALGNAQVDTAQFKFGAAAALFDRSGDAISFADTTGLRLGSGDWTIECWIRPSVMDSTEQTIAFKGTDLAAATSYEFRLNTRTSGTVLQVSNGTSTVSLTGTTNIPAANAWTHVAAVRDGNTLRLFINGNQQGSGVSFTGSVNGNAGAFYIGARNTSGSLSEVFSGHIDEFRFVKGQALYTSSFTPPTAPFPDPPFSSMSFSSTGADQSFVVPAGVTSLVARVWGAGGGSSGATSSAADRAFGGPGGFVKATIAVTPGETLTIKVGRGGKKGTTTRGAGGGGGRSEILRGSTPLVVAGGGGGSGGYGNAWAASWGGKGGGTTGGSGQDGDANGAGNGPGLGGTQSAGGARGSPFAYSGGTSSTAGASNDGGDSAFAGGDTLQAASYPNGGRNPTSTQETGGGGGDGYFGGGAGGGDGSWGNGGGGGSSYTDPGATSVTHTQGTNTSGTGSTAPATGETGYVAGVAVGGLNDGSGGKDGGNGLVVLSLS